MCHLRTRALGRSSGSWLMGCRCCGVGRTMPIPALLTSLLSLLQPSTAPPAAARALLSCGAALEAPLRGGRLWPSSLTSEPLHSALHGPASSSVVVLWKWPGLLAGRACLSMQPEEGGSDAQLVVAQGSWAAWGQGTKHKRQSPCGAPLGHFTLCYKVVACDWSGKRVMAGGLRSNDLKVLE